MSDNRRSSARHAVSIDAKLAVGADASVATASPCTILNLSLGGALVTATKRHAMGARSHITFKVPTMDDPIDIGATVRWADEASVGIQFDGLRARDVWALNEFFKQLGG